MLLLGTIPCIILKLEVGFRNVKLNDQTDLHQTTIDFNLQRKFTLKKYSCTKELNLSTKLNLQESNHGQRLNSQTTL